MDILAPQANKVLKVKLALREAKDLLDQSEIKVRLDHKENKDQLDLEVTMELQAHQVRKEIREMLDQQDQ